MKVSPFTRSALQFRRWRRSMVLAGYEDITDGGGLWELDRGGRIGHVIKDVQVGPDGRTLYAKIVNPLHVS